MTIAHHLRGYRWDTGDLGVELYLDPEMLPTVKNLLPDGARNSDLIEPIELTSRQTVWLAEAIGRSIEVAGFDYFLEADEDWRVVTEMRDSLYIRT